MAQSGLSAEDVAEFVAAQKVVATARPMEWKPFHGAVEAVRFKAPVEADGIVSGDVLLYYNLAVPGWWNFHLALRGHRVFGWHFKPGGRHRNRGACGDGFPRKVKSPHEQHWLPGHGLVCAVALEGMDAATHEDAFIAFCERANLTFTLAYRPATTGEQLKAFTPEDEG